MRVFFSMHSLPYLRLYESTIREMASRGHEIHLAFEHGTDRGWRPVLDTLRAEHPTVTCSCLSPPLMAFWTELAMTIHRWADYLRFLSPDYDSEPTRRAHAAARVPSGLVRLTNRLVFQRPARRRWLRAVLRACEQALPPAPEFEQALRAWRSDVVLITPLVGLKSTQYDVLRTANALGVRTAVCVASWDNLSSKALMRDLPQRVLVWNETQQDEAVRLHGVPPSRIVVTGAQCFDQWFDWQPSGDREEFCQRVGLAQGRPYVLYVCSGLLLGKQIEAKFVRQWLVRLRTSEQPALREVTVLIRPHPALMDEWNDVNLDGFEHVQLYGSTPMDTTAKNDYFDSLYYSRAVVGLNTSAFLEAAIVGRPVHTILLPGYYEYQEGTRHFRYLLTVGGGLVQAGRSFHEHHQLLSASLRRPADAPAEHERFVTAFIRPQGIATPVFCDAIDELLAAPTPLPQPTPWRYVLLRVVMYPLWQGLRRVYGAEVFFDKWSHSAHAKSRKERERKRWRAAKERARQTRTAATMVGRATRRIEMRTARENVKQVRLIARAHSEAEKTRHRRARERAKAWRARRRRWGELRVRLTRVARCLPWVRRQGESER